MTTGAAATAAPSPDTGYWLACRAASHLCALPLTGVIETMRPLPIEAFRRAPPFVAGMAVIRSQPTPVVDMRSLLGEATMPFGRYVTVRIGGRVVALGFDAVEGVHGLPHQRAIELPPLLHSVAGDAISRVGARDAELLLFLEASRIFPPGFVEALAVEETAG